MNRNLSKKCVDRNEPVLKSMNVCFVTYSKFYTIKQGKEAKNGYGRSLDSLL